MSTVAGSVPALSRRTERVPWYGQHARRARFPLLVYLAVVLLTCTWVLSLPLFPSQDEPLHLYYVHIFSQLLGHVHSAYTDHYAIRHLFPPYATYYYALLALGHFAGLEVADKIFLCGCILLFGIAGWVLVRTVNPLSRWAPFLLLPVLLNWPTFMGFANYMLSVDLACLALAVWWKGRGDGGWRYSVLFLILVLGMVFTHPIPWIFTLGFAGLDVLLRSMRAWKGGITQRSLRLKRDIATVALACLPYGYLSHFRAKTQIITRRVFDEDSGTWKLLQHPSLLERLHGQYFSLLHTHGLVLFLGPGWPHAYRLGLDFLLDSILLLALWSVWIRSRRIGWQERDLWLLYTAVLAVALIVVPDEFGGGYFFVKRMQILLYVCAVVAGSEALRRRPALAAGAAVYSIALSLGTLALAAQYITPAARSIASLHDLPPVPPSTRPGLLVRPVGVAFPAHLNFDSFNWAPVDYLRWHGLLLFNTPWLGEPLVPIGPRSEASSLLDPTYFNQAPQFGDPPMADESAATQLFSKAGFVMIQRTCIKRHQDVFAERGGSSQPGSFSRGWRCSDSANGEWAICLPPPSALNRAVVPKRAEPRRRSQAR